MPTIAIMNAYVTSRRALGAAATGLLLAGGLGLVAITTFAAPVIPNRTFDADVEGWTPVDVMEAVTGAIEWDSADAAELETSGSALGKNTSPAGTTRKDFQQCATGVDGGQPYTVKAALFIAQDQLRRGGGEIGLTWYASADCSGVLLSEAQTNTFRTSTDGAWVTVSDTVTSHADANSVAIRLGVTLYEATGEEDPTADFVVLFDNIELLEGGATATASPTASPSSSPSPSPTSTPSPGSVVPRAYALEVARD